jgi:hypothetical protein
VDEFIIKGDVVHGQYTVVRLSISGETLIAGPFTSAEAALAAKVQHLASILELVEVGEGLYELHYSKDCIAGCPSPLSWEQMLALCAGKGIDARRLRKVDRRPRPTSTPSPF